VAILVQMSTIHIMPLLLAEIEPLYTEILTNLLCSTLDGFIENIKMTLSTLVPSVCRRKRYNDYDSTEESNTAFKWIKMQFKPQRSI